jgi:hypothetical protein
MKVKFNFYGFEVLLNSDSIELLDLLKKNFGYFYNKKGQVKKQLIIDVFVQEDYSNIIPKNLIAYKQTINSMSYDVGHVRYNNYYGKAVTVMNYELEAAKIYGSDLNKIHEVAYLMILSRQGKWSDRNGLHKVHAMSVSHKDKNLLVMMPIKGGKTTLFTQFLKDEKYNLISDDSPVINSNGELLSFPIRFGLEDNNSYKELLDSIDDDFKFELEREQFGKKILVDTLFYKNRLSKPAKKTILVQGVRWNSEKCIVEKVSFFKMLLFLKTHLIVGVGLPMVIEYFLQGTFKDHITNLKILFSRTLTAVKLTLKSDRYIAYMSYDIENNFEELKKLID